MIPISLSSFNTDIGGVLEEIKRRGADASIVGQRILRHLLVNTADSSAIASTASETNYSLNEALSSSFFYPGRIFKLTAAGVYSTTGTPTLVFKILFGSTTLLTFTAKTGINNASNQSWRIEAEITCRSNGATGTVMVDGTLFFNTAAGVDTVESVTNNAAVTVDTTTPANLQISATWSASSSSNTTTMKKFKVELSDYV